MAEEKQQQQVMQRQQTLQLLITQTEDPETKALLSTQLALERDISIVLNSVQNVVERTVLISTLLIKVVNSMNIAKRQLSVPVEQQPLPPPPEVTEPNG